jgi:uncharacterized protein (TIGR03437 family)
LRLALLAILSVVAAAQTAPLTLSTYEMFRYAVTGRAFSHRFTPAGGIAPYSFSLEEGSTLPPGLRLNGETGELSGTVPQTGEFRHAVCITDATRAQICVPFLVISVANEGDTYTELLPARVNTEYQNLVFRPGELAEVAYDPASGRLPDGMVLEITGRLYGIPRAPGGAWAFKVRGRDLEGNLVIRPYVLRVLGPLAATTVLPNGFLGTEYSAQLTVFGDSPPHTWTVRRGPLPPGYILSESGRISGICNQPGRYPFALRVTDSTLSSQDREIVLTVEFSLPPLQISTTTLPGASVGAAYRLQLNVTGGRAPYTFRILGTLPPGLTLSPAGLLSGTPTAVSTQTFTVQVTDVSGVAVAKTFTISVANLRYTGLSSLSLFALEPVNVALGAEGGTAPYRWSLIGGALPAGLALSEAGVLTGTATAPGNANVTVRLVDGGGRTLEFPLSVTVGAARPVISTNGIVNGASFAAGGITPGEIVTVFGTRMGPQTLAPFILDGAGRVPSAVAGTRVLFGGQPAPLLYVSATQIGAIVPFAIRGRTTVDVVVDANGVRSEALNVSVVTAAPGLFTVDASGKGQAAALNQDGSLNASRSPARLGEVLVLFGTGEGATLPVGQDGAITGPDTPRPVQPVRVTIGGREGVVLYAGAAPGLVAGVFQVNVRIPADVSPGDAVPVVLRIGDIASASAVTLALR